MALCWFSAVSLPFLRERHFLPFDERCLDRLAYSLNTQLIRKLQNKSELDASKPRCLIVDDTDLPKTGRRIELIGKIFSHVTHTSKLGFKGLFMGYHDGKSFFPLDFILHGEKGKKQKQTLRNNTLTEQNALQQETNENK